MRGGEREGGEERRGEERGGRKWVEEVPYPLGLVSLTVEQVVTGQVGEVSSVLCSFFALEDFELLG